MPTPSDLSARAGLRLGVVSALGALVLTLAAPPASAVFSGVTASVVDGELRITGTTLANHVVVGLSANAQIIEVFTGLTRASEFRFRRTEVSKLTVEAGDGNDVVTIADSFPAVPTTIAGGEGADRLTGGAADEVFLGGADADSVDGRDGADLILLGSGDDQAVWAPGRGRDVVEGQTGSDLVTVDGTIGGDHLEILANGSRLKIFRPGDGDHVDAAGAEQLLMRPGPGADSVNVNDLTGVASVDIDVDLKKPGPGLGDAAADLVEVAGTPGADDITVQKTEGRAVVGRPGGTVRIGGTDAVLDRLVVDADLGADRMDVQPAAGTVLGTRVDGGGGDDQVITNGTAAHDDITVSPVDGRVRVSQLGQAYEAIAEDTVINGLAGPDDLEAKGNLDGITRLVLDGGADNDLINGAAGVEILLGGAGKDQVIGRGGDDVLHLGDDHDTSFWSAGDGDDIVEGGGGSDGLFLFGDDAVDTMHVEALGVRVRITRNADVLDLNDIERTSLHPLGGADVLAVRDLSGTDLYEVVYDLALTGTTSDGQPDTVTVDGTNGNDTIALVGDADFFSAQGLAWSPRIRRTDAADGLILDTKAGLDPVNTTGLAPGTIQLTVI